VNAWEYGDTNGVGGGGHDWHPDRETIEDAFRVEVENSGKCSDSWTAYLIEVTAPAGLDGDALTDYIDDGLVESVPDGRVVELSTFVGQTFAGFTVLNAAKGGRSVLPLGESPAETLTKA
jgi:hypothetical protein